MTQSLPVSPPEFFASPQMLASLAEALNDPATNPLGTIVPYDIHARIDTTFDGRDGAFERALTEAKQLLAKNCPWIHTLLTRIVSYVVPITHRPEGTPVKRGFSSPLCYGAVFLTFEDRTTLPQRCAVELAIDLAHEVGHHSLHTYQTADPILQSNLRTPVYSGVKKVERPAIMSLHASAALLFMIEACARLAADPTLDESAHEHAVIRYHAMVEQQYLALDAIRGKVTPTKLGERIISEMENQLVEFKSLAIS